MNNLRKIVYTKILEEKQERLKQELASVNKEIMDNYCNEEHICVRIYDVYQTMYGFEGRCLFCRKTLEEPTRLYVNTGPYREDIYSEYIPEQRERRFEDVRSIAFDIIKENPDISSEELTMRLNNIMCQEVGKRESEKIKRFTKTKKH